MATLLEMKNLAPTNIPVAEVEAHNPAQHGNLPVAHNSAQHGNLPVAQPGLTQAQIAALQPLENGITYLGVNRDTLEGLRTKHSTRRNGFFADSYFKRGTPAHHRAQAKELRTGKHFAHHITSTVPLKDIAKTHEAIANRIDEVKAAHEALLRSHPDLAKKDGSMGKKNRKYKILSGAWQSLGNYHGKNITEDGTPKTFEGGRKTRKHRRKRKTRKRKTRKRKTKKHKRKRKTRRKTRKHKKTTRRGRKRRTSKKTTR